MAMSSPAALSNTFSPSSSIAVNPGLQALRTVGEWFQLPIISFVDWVSVSRHGLAPESLDLLLEHGYSRNELSWIIAPRTLSHRRSKREKLTPEESGRVLRAAKIQAMAEAVFGDQALAQDWLSEKRPSFGDLSAKELMQTEQGGQWVEETLGRLDAGYFA
jgi:putative toxin-antitoxin system antitoxin component (TIGR02293 family)